MDKTRVLIVEANPRDTAYIKLNKESAIIENTLDEAGVHDTFELKKISTATGKDLYDKLWQYKPNIVHFCGHGEKNNLLFVDDTTGNTHRIEKSLLIELFEQFSDSIYCALFNACDSNELAEGMVQHIDYAIGMNEPVWDDTSLNFATGFYRGLFKTCDIKKAFQSGLMAVKFANLSQQQHIPVLKCRQTFEPSSTTTQPLANSGFITSYQYDVLIHVADNEKDWAQALTTELQKHLAAKFGSQEAFNLTLKTGEVDFSKTATALLLLSPSYISQYQPDVNFTKHTLDDKRLFVTEYSGVPMPEALKGLSVFRFWKFDETTGIQLFSRQDVDYSVRLAELAASLYNSLQQQKKNEASRQRNEEQRQASSSSVNDNGFVFVNVAPQDRELISAITEQLKQHGIDYILPPDDYSQMSPSDIRRDLEYNFLDSDAVLLLCRNSPVVWVRGQLRCYRTVRNKRNQALKIIAVALYREDDLNMNLAELKIFHCDPEKVSGYLSDFVEALQ